MKNIFISFFVFVFFLKVLSAQHYSQISLINGEIFYNHTVVEGNSIINLHKMYSCSVDEIINLNPGVERGLDLGQIILLPAKRTTFYHTVKPKETLYSLSKLFLVSIDTIQKYNLNSIEVLKIGQNLKIVDGIQQVLIDSFSNSKLDLINSILPETNTINSRAESDSIITHFTKLNQTLYSISNYYKVTIEDIQRFNNLKSVNLIEGQIIKIPIKKESISKNNINNLNSQNISMNLTSAIKFNADSLFSVAIFLPLYLDTSSKDIKNSKIAAIEFYKAIKIARDKLNLLNVKADIYIYDYFSKKLTLEQQLDIISTKNVDLVFAPFHEKEANIVFEWSKNNNIPIVYSVSLPKEMTTGYQNAYFYYTPPEIMIRKMAEELVNKSIDDRLIVLIKSDSSDDNTNHAIFLNAFKSHSAKVKNASLIEATWENYQTFKNSGQLTQFIFLSTNEKKVFELISNYSKDLETQIFGLKDWLNYKDLKLEANKHFNFYYYSSRFVDSSNPDVDDFKSLYASSNNKALPTEWAYYAYDVIHNACKYLFTGINDINGLAHNFDFENNINGFQNTGCFLLKYQNSTSKIGLINE